MRFVCNDHGEVEPVEVSGYNVGHSTSRNGPNELDLEGVTFKLSIDDDGSVKVESEAEDYLSKFSNWRKEVVKAVKEVGVIDDGGCPECGHPVWLLEDDEEVPEP